MSLIPASRSLVPARRPLPAPREAVAAAGRAVARRLVPVVSASAATVVATVAAERALAGLALRAVGDAGSRVITPRERATAIRRTVVTEVTVVERVRRRR